MCISKWMLFKRPTPPPSEFVEWCKKEPDVKPTVLSLDQFMRDHKNLPDQNKLVDDFIAEVHSRIQAGTAHVQLNKGMTRQEIKICGEKAFWERGIYHLDIAQGISGILAIENISIHRLNIDNISEFPVRMHLECCNIGSLSIGRRELYSGCIELECVNTNIGRLEMKETPLHSLNMVGGCILGIECPPPGEKSPVSGDVTFTNVFFPRNTNDCFLSGAQAYRSFRHHLMVLQNIQAANLIRSVELAVERETDYGMNKLLSWVYELFSDSGSSTWRPIAWLLGLFVISTLAIFWTGGTAQGLPDAAIYSGWRSVLVEPDSSAWQAAYLAFQPVINPLGMFSSKALLVPKNGWIVALLMVQGLLSPILIALFIFSVRRRFRLHG